eukprot:g626.t1
MFNIIFFFLFFTTINACSPFDATAFADMHDGDVKTVSLNSDYLLTISQKSPNWTVSAPINAIDCSAMVDFSLSRKPEHPPVPLKAKIVRTNTDAVIIKFSDPSGTISSDDESSLNIWTTESKRNPSTCRDFPSVSMFDMHDGDVKVVSFAKHGKALKISQVTPKWSLQVPFDMNSCSAMVDFSKSDKPKYPPVALKVQFVREETGRNLAVFSDPSKTISSSRFPLNIWESKEENALGSATLYGVGKESLDLELEGKKLLSQLNFEKGIFHASKELFRTEKASMHLFATNRTEACHYHKGTTLAQTVKGQGAFRVPYSLPVLQNAGDSFFIPEGEVHAFGPLENEPVLVTVLWSPPLHQNYTINVPESGCIRFHEGEDMRVQQF